MRKALKQVGRRLKAPLNNQRGVALMIAIASLMVIMFFAMEVTYDANVEYIVNSQGLNRVKAYYAAKSGMQLSLLRIKIFQQAQNQFGDQLGNSAMLDKIWQFPFAWPMPIPDELNAVDKDNFAKINKESQMDSSYFVTIEDEGSKIDLNDLNSPSKTLQETAKLQIMNIFDQKKQSDEAFRNKHSNTRFDELINAISDWMSDKNLSLNGGDKREKYAELNRDSQDYFPPNRGFRTISELHMVPGMTDEFYDLLAPRVTIYGMKGINPNLATKEVLKSLDPGMTDEIVSALIKRRDSEQEGGPFKCDQSGGSQDFWQFAQDKGLRALGDTSKIPMTCETVMNFKIKSTGEFGGAVREITAIVMDLNRMATKIKAAVDKDKQNDPNTDPTGTSSGGGTSGSPPGAGAGTGNQQQKAKKAAIPKGPPRIVYWTEK